MWVFFMLAFIEFFYQNQFVNECGWKKSWNSGVSQFPNFTVFLWDVEELTFLIIYKVFVCIRDPYTHFLYYIDYQQQHENRDPNACLSVLSKVLSEITLFSGSSIKAWLLTTTFIIFSPFLFPSKNRGKRKGEWSSKNRDQNSCLYARSLFWPTTV